MKLQNNNNIKIVFIMIFIQNSLGLKRIGEICYKESDMPFQTKFNQPDLNSLTSNSRVSGKGQFGKVYIVDYNSKSLNKTINLAMKEILVTEDSPLDMIAKEISYTREFSDIDPERFLQFINCFYSKREGNVYVYILTEVLDDELFNGRNEFYELSRIIRFQNYLKIVDDVRDFHKNVERNYLDSKAYVHLDIKLSNMMFIGDIPSGNFKIKHIDYGLMEKKGEDIYLRGTPGYIHPDMYKKHLLNKVKAEPKYDVYALIISIAQLEFGYKYGDISNDCTKIFPEKCLTDLKINIYKGFCKRYNKKMIQKEYDNFIIEANDRNIKCTELICIIFRNMNKDLSKLDNAESLYQSLKVLTEESAKNKLILI